MTSSAPNRTSVLAAFLAQTQAADLPDRLFDLAALYVLDTLGAIRFGVDQPWSQIAAAHGRRTMGDTGPVGHACTVIGHDWKATPPVAAFVNGAAGHAFELDDVHDETIMHPGTVVIPAAFAVAEELDASGEQFLAAVVMGYEAAARAGLAVNPGVHMLRGFHPTGTMGVFGSAAAAGILLGLGAARMRHALGVAASFAGGIMEFSQSGGMVKRIHGGRAAEGGVQASYLAHNGLEGPAAGLDGKFGFCNTFSDEPRLEMLTEGLGSRFMIDEITVKPYACCSDVHPIIDALVDIKTSHDIDPENIRSIEIDAPTKVAEQNSLDGTTSIMAAQYSAKFVAAATLLLDIQNPHVFNERSLRDPAIRALHDKVHVRKAMEFDIEYARKIGARVSVIKTNGERFTSTVRGARGSMHRPLTREEVENKFRFLCKDVVDDDTSANLIEIVREARSMRSVSSLTRCLRG